MVIGGDGRFQLISLLGGGGMADIWFARDLSVNLEKQPNHPHQNVAVKALRSDFVSQAAGSTRSSEFVQQLAKRFDREARFLKELKHKNIATFIASGNLPSGIPFMVMEYLEGATLEAEIFTASESRGVLQTRFVEKKKQSVYADPEDVKGIISENTVMPLGDIFRISEALLEGLSYLHNPKGTETGTGITHRDLKPANIMVQRNASGEITSVKILDLGIAKVADDVRNEYGIETQLTKIGSLIGTRTFMPKEQFLDSMNAGPQADVYAAGITLFMMITGTEPYARCKNEFEQMSLMPEAEPFDPGKYVSDVPPKLCEVVIKATRREVKDRYKNAFEMWHDLVQARWDALDFVSGVSPTVATICSQPTVESDPPPPLQQPPVQQAPTIVRRPSRVQGRGSGKGMVIAVAALTLLLGLGVGVFMMKNSKNATRELPVLTSTSVVPESKVPQEKKAVADESESEEEAKRPLKRKPRPRRVERVSPPPPPPAPAPAPASTAMNSAARAYFDSGLSFFKYKRYGMALEKFQEAEKQAPNNSEIKAKIAECLARM
jgi:serine/threonine-protein kinase